MRYYRFTPDDDSRIAEMINAGSSAAEIASAMERSEATIYSRLKFLCLKPRTDKSYRGNALTEAEEILLVELINKKLSAAEIGKRMGRSRNSIIGHANRRGLSIGHSRSKASNVSNPPRRKKEKPKPQSAAVHTYRRGKWSTHIDEIVTVPEGQRRGLLERHDNQCCWPIGDPLEPGFHYCHNVRAGKSSYCEHHDPFFKVKRIKGKGNSLKTKEKMFVSKILGPRDYLDYNSYEVLENDV